MSVALLVVIYYVLESMEDGATPEAIAQRYPAATLADIYGVLAYYLRHQQEISVYLAGREQKAEEVRKRVEGKRRDWAELRDRLLSCRRAASA